MTYVEKMANKIRAHIFEGINENIPDLINQIIADTKRECILSILNSIKDAGNTAEENMQAMNHLLAIGPSEVKEQKK